MLFVSKDARRSHMANAGVGDAIQGDASLWQTVWVGRRVGVASLSGQ